MSKNTRLISYASKGTVAGYLLSPLLEIYVHSFLSHRYFEMNKTLQAPLRQFFTCMGLSPLTSGIRHRFHHGPMSQEPIQNRFKAVLISVRNNNTSLNETKKTLADPSNRSSLVFKGLDPTTDPILIEDASGELQVRPQGALGTFFSRNAITMQIPFVALIGSTAALRTLRSKAPMRESLKESTAFFTGMRGMIFLPGLVSAVYPETRIGYVRGDQPQGSGIDRTKLWELTLFGRIAVHNLHHREPQSPRLPAGMFDRDETIIQALRKMRLVTDLPPAKSRSL
jgi:hypothetical protein